MPESFLPGTPHSETDPETVAAQSFAVVRKGFDQNQVRSYLEFLANRLQDAQQSIRKLQSQVAEAQPDSESDSERTSPGVTLLDDGLEASRRRLEIEAKDIVAQAQRVAKEIQRILEGWQSQKLDDGHEEIVGLLSEAQNQTQQVADLLEKAQSQARDEVECGRREGRKILEQAKALRLKVLRDMAQRRHVVRVQVERLRAGRDKLLENLGEVRQSVDQSVESVKLSLSEAKVAADSSARRAEEEDEPTDSSLLSELETYQGMELVLGDSEKDGDDSEQPADEAVGQETDEAPAEAVREETDEAPAEAVGQETDEAPDGSDDDLVLVEDVANHPVLAEAQTGPEVDDLFARLRSRSE